MDDVTIVAKNRQLELLNIDVAFVRPWSSLIFSCYRLVLNDAHLHYREADNFGVARSEREPCQCRHCGSTD